MYAVYLHDYLVTQLSQFRDALVNIIATMLQRIHPKFSSFQYESAAAAIADFEESLAGVRAYLHISTSYCYLIQKRLTCCNLVTRWSLGGNMHRH